MTNRIVKAHAVIDGNGNVPLSPDHDLYGTEAEATRIAKARARVAWPMYKGVKWKVVPVEIKVKK